ncbi:hypothetical protein [Algoriphagus sp. CAU 1675]|uniref:hypothetical protein n=1 Tax=Algoriphagus sp. CAU 1675 TaxID=3032597 RepID=UPI0023DA4857|nr:hypothetical protein [Algoriphagus sp. CAU 1675]MDF2158434.1 hypothetical protein [Algoriphagus sp. CAU 1675]
MQLKIRVLSSILLVVLLGSCSSGPEKQAKNLLEKSISAHGGMDNWESVEVLKFRKWTRLLKEDGSVESETDQSMEFRLKPFFEGKITWISDSVEHVSYFDGAQMRYSVGGNEIQNQDFLAAKKKDMDAAFYVIAQPWKLLQDEGSKLTYEGVRETPLGLAEVIRVDYGSDEDVWWYYFDPESFLMTGNEVQLKDHRSLIENLSSNNSSPFVFYGERKSYRINEKGEKLYLRAEYLYSDFEVIL